MTNDPSIIKDMKAVKIGLEVFGIEKRLKNLEDTPRTLIQKGGSADTSGLLKLDQTTPQTITGGTPNLNLDNATAPTGKADGYLSVVDDILWYFAGGHRYKLTATLDDPVAGVSGSPIGLLLTLTYP